MALDGSASRQTVHRAWFHLFVDSQLGETKQEEPLAAPAADGLCLALATVTASAASVPAGQSPISGCFTVSEQTHGPEACPWGCWGCLEDMSGGIPWGPLWAGQRHRHSQGSWVMTLWWPQEGPSIHLGGPSSHNQISGLLLAPVPPRQAGVSNLLRNIIPASSRLGKKHQRKGDFQQHICLPKNKNKTQTKNKNETKPKSKPNQPNKKSKKKKAPNKQKPKSPETYFKMASI